MTVADLSMLGPVLPIATIERVEDALPLASAVQEGGLRALEVTLRTPVALEAIAAIAAALPDLLVGAGTVLRAEQVKAARSAGARFLVTPGVTSRLLDALEDCGLPALCGCATPTEVAQLLDRGYTEMKLFPAEAIGGIELLRALAGPFPEARFCPTGGIALGRVAGYLALPNVSAVGGGWVTERDPLRPDWRAVSRAARAAAALGG